MLITNNTKTLASEPFEILMEALSRRSQADLTLRAITITDKFRITDYESQE